MNVKQSSRCSFTLVCSLRIFYCPPNDQTCMPRVLCMPHVLFFRLLGSLVFSVEYAPSIADWTTAGIDAARLIIYQLSSNKLLVHRVRAGFYFNLTSPHYLRTYHIYCTQKKRRTRSCLRVRRTRYTRVFFFFNTSTFQLLDKPWSQVSSLLPPGSCLQCLSRIGFSNPTARRFFIDLV